MTTVNRGERGQLAAIATTGQGTAAATLIPADGTGYTFDRPCSTITWGVARHAGTVTSASVTLESSVDGGTTWYTLDTSAAAVTATPEIRHITGKAVPRVRANIGAIVGGGSVDVWFVAV